MGMYVVLGYGYANFTVLGIPVGYLLFFILLGITVIVDTPITYIYVKEPIFLFSLLLIIYTLGHLGFDIPKNGLYSIRDASMTIELLALLVGFAWTVKYSKYNIYNYIRALFILNFIYSLTFFISDRISAISPVSGVFQPVPLLGYYTHSFLFLLVGSIYFYLQTGSYKHAGINIWLARIQLLWAFIFEARTTYISIVLIVIILLFFKKFRIVLDIATTIIIGAISVILLGSLFGIFLEGRVGTVSIDFFVTHILSIFLKGDSVAIGSAEHRLRMLSESINIWTTNWSSILFGVGFGKPIINVYTTGIQIRNPHNTHLSFLVRLGIIGFLLWAGICIRTLKLILINIRTAGGQDKNNQIWILVYFACGIVLTTFQPWLEFPYGTIPFYIVIGYSIGIYYKNKAIYGANIGA